MNTLCVFFDVGTAFLNIITLDELHSSNGTQYYFISAKLLGKDDHLTIATIQNVKKI
jgi:hypothetical protein